MRLTPASPTGAPSATRCGATSSRWSRCRPSRTTSPSIRTKSTRSIAGDAAFDFAPLEELRLGPAGAEGRQPGDPSRRNLRPARPQRRRQDHADQHRVRHRAADFGQRDGRRTRHPARLPLHAGEDRPGAAGAAYRHVRDGVGHGELQPRPVRAPARPRPPRERAATALVMGQAQRQDHDAVGRHEAAGADRQGAGARARGAVPRRAHRGRRRGAAPRHVDAGAPAARRRRHRDPHHALHRRGRGDGRPHRRDQQGRADRGRGEERADEEARQEAAHPAPGAAFAGFAHPALRVEGFIEKPWQRARIQLRCARRARRNPRPAAAPGGARHRLHRPSDQTELARRHFYRSGPPEMNRHAIAAIYKFEMARFKRTLWQSLATPVITTSLYFVVFGAAIGSRMSEIGGVPYGAFIVPGLIMLSIFTESLSNASFGIYLPKFTGTIYEVLSAPVSPFELVLAYVGAAATKSIVLGLIILATANIFVPVSIAHPFWMIAFLVLTATTFCLFGFILGIWANGFDQLQFVPMLVITPLTFLGGAFYSIDMLPAAWRAFSLFNPVVYLISGFRWSFYGTEDVPVLVSLGMTLGFFFLCLAVVAWIFRTGYRLKT